MPENTATPAGSDAAEALRTAAERVETRRSELDAAGVSQRDAERLADAHRAVVSVFDRWEERATDWDDFEGYVEFRNDLAETLESIPEDVPEREAFLEADGHVKTSGVSKSLDVSDFDAAREALGPVRDVVERYEALESATQRRREASRRGQRRRSELRERIDALRRLVELGEADLDAPIDRLREPISAYNDAIEDRFETFRREAPARRFLSVIDRAARTPLVGYERPPGGLLAYVRAHDAGDRPVPDVLEFAEYSNSKLSHYVEDPGLLKRRVATNRTYLEGLSAAPLRIEWPPKPGGTLRFRTDELVSVVDRIAEEPTIATLREVRSLTRDPEYERLRRAANARSELTADERRRLENGEIEAELSAARSELERLEAALDEHGG
ncbi:DUF7118 family protein [Natronomonas sp.]|uniref:DUF7118 family protein n=1 Tax=Natronomonas sp. TaxID=2184060 RepID=UPI002627A779|nr:hypothetical protein [Natronomonas sp.]